MKKLFSFFVLIVSLFATVSFAQDNNVVISPQSIVVNPKPSFTVEVFTDRDSSGNQTPAYQIGEEIQIGVRVSETAYVYLFNIKSSGEIQQILPNRYDERGQNNRVRAGETRYFPRDDAPYTFDVDGPRGLDKVIAVASRDQLDTSQLVDFTRDPNFASSRAGEEDFARGLSIVVRPKPQNSWVTDTTLFYVGSAPSTPTYGTLDISSSPSGAEAYVDDQFIGYTPVRYGTTSGSHNVRVQLSGYDGYSESVSVNGGRTVNVSATLAQTRRTGSVTFTSQPDGAQVYVNGQFLGTTPTASVTLDEGSYQARFVRDGYGETNVDFTVRANSSQTVSGGLQSQSQAGSLEVTANVGGAQVFVNGQFVGNVANGSGRLTVPNLPAGTHELVVSAAGFSTYVSEFRISSGQATEVRVRQAQR